MAQLLNTEKHKAPTKQGFGWAASHEMGLLEFPGPVYLSEPDLSPTIDLPVHIQGRHRSDCPRKKCTSLGELT